MREESPSLQGPPYPSGPNYEEKKSISINNQLPTWEIRKHSSPYTGKKPDIVQYMIVSKILVKWNKH